MVVDEVYSSNWYFVFLGEQGKTWAQTLKGACVTIFIFYFFKATIYCTLRIQQAVYASLVVVC